MNVERPTLNVERRSEDSAFDVGSWTLGVRRFLAAFPVNRRLSSIVIAGEMGASL
jgi:hypothetical protein